MQSRLESESPSASSSETHSHQTAKGLRSIQARSVRRSRVESQSAERKQHSPTSLGEEAILGLVPDPKVQLDTQVRIGGRGRLPSIHGARVDDRGKNLEALGDVVGNARLRVDCAGHISEDLPPKDHIDPVVRIEPETSDRPFGARTSVWVDRAQAILGSIDCTRRGDADHAPVRLVLHAAWVIAKSWRVVARGVTHLQTKVQRAIEEPILPLSDGAELGQAQRVIAWVWNAGDGDAADRKAEGGRREAMLEAAQQRSRFKLDPESLPFELYPDVGQPIRAPPGDVEIRL